MELWLLFLGFIGIKAYEKWKAESILQNSIYVDFKIRGIFITTDALFSIALHDSFLSVINSFALLWLTYGIANIWDSRKLLQDRENEKWSVIASNGMFPTMTPKLWLGI